MAIKETALDRHAFASFGHLLGDDNSDDLDRLRHNLRIAIESDLTERQRHGIILYYAQNFKEREIAEIWGVNISTVSRTLKRGRERLKRCIKYGAAKLLET